MYYVLATFELLKRQFDGIKHKMSYYNSEDNDEQNSNQSLASFHCSSTESVKNVAQNHANELICIPRTCEYMESKPKMQTFFIYLVTDYFGTRQILFGNNMNTIEIHLNEILACRLDIQVYP